MASKQVRVLGIHNKGAGFGSLFQYLGDRGCTCEIAASYSEGIQFFRKQPFDLVLCSGEPGIETLLASVEGSSASVYCAHLVEAGCWWFPVIQQGRKCLGEPALRSSEFADVLSRMLEKAKSAAGAV